MPGELLDVVLAIVRDRPLAPVARITTKRESQVLYGALDTALAEFSNDHVIAWAAIPRIPRGVRLGTAATRMA